MGKNKRSRNVNSAPQSRDKANPGISDTVESESSKVACEDRHNRCGLGTVALLGLLAILGVGLTLQLDSTNASVSSPAGVETNEDSSKPARSTPTELSVPEPKAIKWKRIGRAACSIQYAENFVTDEEVEHLLDVVERSGG